jgi:autonomous glycyl radical cofactor GrcA
MENHTNMDINKVNIILNELGDTSNNDLLNALDFLDSEFETTKESIIRLTKHLDNTEIVYNRILKELDKRKVVKVDVGLK